MLFRYRDYGKVEGEWVQVFKSDYFKLSAAVTSVRGFESVFRPNGEALVFALRGSLRIDGNIYPKEVELQAFDMAYIPMGMEVRIRVNEWTMAYIAESWADKQYQFYVKRRSQVTPIKSGLPPYERAVYTMIGEGDPANSFLAGYTEGTVGNWTSYPPHRHDGKPEAYIFYGIGPGFAIQAVLSEDSEEAYVVHDYDVVLITKGYHPNVASTINSIKYAWVIAAPRGQRTLAVEVHPAFKNLPMGQTHLTVK